MDDYVREDRVLKLTDDQWLTIGRMAKPRYYHNMVYVEGQWWMVGGYVFSGGSSTNRIELWTPGESEYGPELSSWWSRYGFAIIY